MLLLLEFSPLLSNRLLQVLLFFLQEIGKRRGVNDWIIPASHKSGTSSPATSMRHRAVAMVQEFCPDSSKTVLFLSSKDKRHQSAASRSQSYCSRLYSNFTRVNWTDLKQWALIQWKNTEGSVWNDWLTHYIKMKFFSITSKWKTKNFYGKVKIKWLIFISPSSQLFLGNQRLSQIFSLQQISKFQFHRV